MDIQATIRKYVLQNAALHDGKAQAGAIIGKLIAEDPTAKDRMKELAPLIQKEVSIVNKMKLDDQKAELEKTAPELLERKKEEERTLPPLQNATEGKVVTRFPPEPSGHPHLGHAFSFWLNRMYADMYKGKVWLRFEDTDATHAKKEYYQAFRDALKWLGLSYEMEKNLSDDMPLFYSHGEALLKKGVLYACTCKPEQVKDNRGAGKECACQKRSADENLKLWASMRKDLPEGGAVIRLKGDMQSDNMDLRDPVMFRIVLEPHVLQGTKYRVWPTYDFAGSIEDAVCGITHVLRSAEFEQRAILQAIIRKALGFKEPEMVHYSRMGIEGVETSKRKTRAMIEEGIIDGWDDPRLATIAGLKRRGILPETFKELAVMIGPSRSSPLVEWKMLLSVNRKFLDPIANRYYVVRDPVKLTVEGAPKLDAELAYHPEFPDRGKRKVPTAGSFFIEQGDVDKMKAKDVIRLKDLYNVEIVKVSKSEVVGKFAGRDMTGHETVKVHWVTDDFIKVKVIVPDVLFIGEELNPKSLEVLECYGEKAISALKEGEQIQMERFGFARVDSKDPLTFVFTSK